MAQARANSRCLHACNIAVVGFGSRCSQSGDPVPAILSRPAWFGIPPKLRCRKTQGARHGARRGQEEAGCAAGRVRRPKAVCCCSLLRTIDACPLWPPCAFHADEDGTSGPARDKRTRVQGSALTAVEGRVRACRCVFACTGAGATAFNVTCSPPPSPPPLLLPSFAFCSTPCALWRTCQACGRHWRSSRCQPAARPWRWQSGACPQARAPSGRWQSVRAAIWAARRGPRERRWNTCSSSTPRSCSAPTRPGAAAARAGMAG